LTHTQWKTPKSQGCSFLSPKRCVFGPPRKPVLRFPTECFVNAADNTGKSSLPMSLPARLTYHFFCPSLRSNQEAHGRGLNSPWFVLLAIDVGRYVPQFFLSLSSFPLRLVPANFPPWSRCHFPNFVPPKVAPYLLC